MKALIVNQLSAVDWKPERRQLGWTKLSWSESLARKPSEPEKSKFDSKSMMDQGGNAKKDNFEF